MASDPWTGSVLPLQEPRFDIVPLSAKIRRTLSNSDEEIVKEQDTKEVGLRWGWPILPPLPLNTFTKFAADSIPNPEQHIAAARMILETHHITVLDISFAWRLPQEQTSSDEDDDEYLTLLIRLDMNENRHRIQNALLAIRRTLKQSPSTSAVMIEFLDYRATPAGLFSFPISVKQKDIIQAWGQTSTGLIDRYLKGKRWLSIECVMRGLGPDISKCKPAICITTPTAANDEWWTDILPQMRSEIQGQAFWNKFHVRFEVDILQATTIFVKPRKERIPKKSEPFMVETRTPVGVFQQTVPMGSSIGQRNDPQNGSATVGGFLQLKGIKINFGITNWHVVRNDFLDTIVNAQSPKALNPSFTRKQTQQKPQVIECPSKTDHIARISELKQQRDVWTHAVGSQDDAQEYLDKVIEELDKVENFGTKNILGVVEAGSGRRTVQAYQYNRDPSESKAKGHELVIWPMDWALISLQNRNIANKISGDPRESFPWKLTDKGKFTSLVDKRNADTWSLFELGDEDIMVAKYGRTTKWTFGQINPCLVNLNPDNDTEIANAYGFTESQYGKAWAVGSRYNDLNYTFIESGDSGSICVYDPQHPRDFKLHGTWLGLMFGKTTTGQGLMLPIDLVFQDIEKMLNTKVVNPRQTDSIN